MNSPTRSSTSGVSVTEIEPVAGEVMTEPTGESIALIAVCKPLYTESCAFIVIFAVLSDDTEGEPDVPPPPPPPPPMPAPPAPDPPAPALLLDAPPLLLAPLTTFVSSFESPGMATT